MDSVKNMDLKTMPKQEKKKFLSMDLAERMMRIEQSVGASFNKYLPYQQTEYYKSMTAEERTSFKKYLKNKNKKRLELFIIMLLPFVLLFIFQFNFTGNVVKQTIGGETSLIFEIILIVIIVASFYFIMQTTLLNKKHERDFKKYLSVLQDSLGSWRKEGF